MTSLDRAEDYARRAARAEFVHLVTRGMTSMRIRQQRWLDAFVADQFPDLRAYLREPEPIWGQYPVAWRR